METGKFSDNVKVIENGLVSGDDRVFKFSYSTFRTSAIGLTNSERVFTSTCHSFTKMEIGDTKIILF